MGGVWIHSLPRIFFGAPLGIGEKKSAHPHLDGPLWLSHPGPFFRGGTKLDGASRGMVLGLNAFQLHGIGVAGHELRDVETALRIDCHIVRVGKNGVGVAHGLELARVRVRGR